MKSPLFRLLPLALLLCAHSASLAQNEKALNFYEALLKRPGAGPLFEQFYNAWADAETIGKLESFLTTQAEKSPDARMVLAVFHSRQGALEKSADEWRRVVKDAPQRADAWLALAETEARLRRTAEALEAAERGLRTTPAPDLKRRLMEFKGRTLSRNNQRDEARAVWDTLLKENPDDQDLREDYIDLLAETGDNDAAVQAARELADATTDPYRRVLRRTKAGDLLARQQAPDKAIAEYSAALADTGSGSWLEKDLLRQIETVLRRADRVEDLTGFMEKLAAKAPQRLAVRRTLARLLTEQDKKDEAEKVWRGLLLSAPGDRELAEAFIQSLTESAHHAGAAEQWRGLIKLHPAEAELHLKLAAALHAAKDDTGCAAAVRGFLKTSGSTEVASLRAAAELSKYKLKPEAIALLAETAQKFPASEQARLQYASALHGADKKEEALAAWRTGAALPDRLLPAARSAMAHGEHSLTWELLEPHLADFAKDAPALTFICEAAQRAEKWPAGLAQAQRLMALASDPVMLGDALTLTLRIAERGKLTALLRKDLESRRAQLSPAESCLLAELLQTSGDRTAAAALLGEVSAREPALGLALLVRLHITAKEFTAAARAQQRIVEGPGGRKALHIQRLAELCTNAKQFTEALRWTGEWKKLAPGSTAPWLKEAALLTDSGRPAEAVRSIQQASHLWPDDTEILGRLATLLTASGQAASAQQVYLRLFEKAETTQEKLRWLPAMAQNANNANLLDSLISEFERRRLQNRQSPVPLLALAELQRQRGDSRRRLELMREAARLGQGDPELLTRSATIAVEEGLTELAESLLIDAAALDKSGAALQQRAAILLQLDRPAEAAAILTQLAAALNADDSAELASALAQAGHVNAAALFLRDTAARFPDNYRLAWLAARLTEDAGDKAAALREYVRLATAAFEPMPEPQTLPESAGQLAPNDSILTPVRGNEPPPGSGPNDENIAILRAMQERNPLAYRTSYQEQVPRVPGAVWQLRGWAAGNALRLANADGADSVAAAKDALLKSGLRPAIFSEAVARGNGIVFSINEALSNLKAYPQDREWIIRYLLGPLPAAEASGRPAWVPFVSDFSAELRLQVSLEAWRCFRESDPPYAVCAALSLIGAAAPDQQKAAEEAVLILENTDTPGRLLDAAWPALTKPPNATDPPQGSPGQRLLARAASWLAAAPPGPVRDKLRSLRLQQLRRGADPVAFLNILAEEIASGSPNAPPAQLNAFDQSAYYQQQTMWSSYSQFQSPWSRAARQFQFQRSANATNVHNAFYSQQAFSTQQTGAPGPALALPLPCAFMLLLPPASQFLTPPGQPVSTFAGPLIRAAGLMQSGPWTRDREKLRKAVEQCSHAGLKALVSLLLEDDSLTSRCMEALTAEQPAVAEHLMIAAAWEWRHRHAERAIALLEQAGNLEPADGPRHADTAIIAAVNLLLWAKEPLPEPVNKLGRAALERWHSFPQLPQHRGALATVAGHLGMEELSAALLTGPVQTSQGQAAPAPVASRSNPLAGLIMSLQNARRSPARGTKGQPPRPDQVVQQLLAAARQTVEPEARQRYYTRQASPTKVDEKEEKLLHAAVVTELERRAAEAKEAPAALTAALALLRYDSGPGVLPAVKRALSLAPGDQRLRSIAVQAVAARSPLSAPELAKGLPAAERAGLMMEAVTATTSGSVALLAAALDAADQWLAALHEMHAAPAPPDVPAAAQYFGNPYQALQVLEASCQSRKGVVLPQFAEPAGSRPAVVIDPEHEPLAKRRRDVLVALYRELIHVPVFAELAVQKMAAAEAAGEVKWDTRRDDVLTVILKGSVSQVVPRSVWPARGTTAEQILLEEAVLDPAWLEKTVLPAVRADAGKIQLAENLTRVLPLLTCSEAEFAAATEDRVNPADTTPRYAMSWQAPGIAGLRGFHALLPDLAARVLADGGAGLPPGTVYEVIRQLHARGGQPAVDAWVEKVCGPPQLPDIWLRPAAPQGSMGTGMAALAQLHMTQSGQRVADVVAGLRLLRALERPLLALPAEVPARLQGALIQPDGRTRAQDGISILEAAGFLADLPDFHLILRVSNSGRRVDVTDWNAQCPWWLRSLAANGDDGASSALLTSLEKNYTHTFGGRLAAAILREARAARGDTAEPKGKKAEILAVLAADLPRLKILPEERQMEYFTLEHRRVQEDQSVLPAEEWLTQLERAFWSGHLTALEAMSDRELAQHNSLNHVLPRILEHLLPAEPDRVLRLLARVASLSNVQSLQGTSVPDLVAGVLTSWNYDPSSQINLQRLSAVLCLLGGSKAGAPDPHLIAERCEAHLRWWLMPKEGPNPQDLLLILSSRLESVPADLLSEKEALLLLPLAAQLATSLCDNSDAPLATQAAAALEADGPGERLRTVLAKAFQLAALHFERKAALQRVRLERSRAVDNPIPNPAKNAAAFAVRVPRHLPLPDTFSAGGLSEPQKQLLEILTDNSLPVALRRALLTAQSQSAPLWLEPALIAAAVPLLETDPAAAPFRPGADHTLALKLARAALQFPAPQTDEGRAAERSIVAAVLEIHPARSWLEPWWLLLAARSSDDDQVLAAVREEASLTKERLDGVFRMLVNTRRFAAARALLDEVPDKLFPGSDYPGVADELYSPATPKNVTDFLLTLPDGPLRPAAEVLMAASWDAPELTEKDSPPRSGRLLKLAEALSKSGIPPEWLRRLATAFTNEPRAQQLIQPLLLKAMEGSSFTAVLKMETTLQQPYWQFLQSAAYQGRIEPLARAIDEILAAPDLDRPREAEKVLILLRKEMQPVNDRWSQESHAACRALMRRGALDSRLILKEPKNSAASRLAQCLAIHAAADAMPEMDAAWAALPGAHRGVLEALPFTSGYILEYIHNPVADRFPGRTPPALPASLIDRRHDALLRLLRSTYGLPGLTHGTLLYFERREATAFADDRTYSLKKEILSVLPALLLRHDAQAMTALSDMALMLVDAGRVTEVQPCIEPLTTALSNTPPSSRTEACRAMFILRDKIEGAEAALTWALGNSALITAGLTDRNSYAAAGLHTAINLSDSAVLKSAGMEAWQQKVLTRLAAAPESALAVFHAACTLEKIAESEGAAGRKPEAHTAMALAVLAADLVDKLQPELLDSSSREIFTANYADHAQRAGEKVDFVELLPLGSEWEYSKFRAYRRNGSDDFAKGRAPVGWDAEGLTTRLEKPQLAAVENVMVLKSTFAAGDKSALAGFGTLYAVLCDHEDPAQPFTLNESTLTWSDSGRPERAPDLAVLSKNPQAAAGAVNVRTTLLGPQWVRQGKNSLTVIMNIKDRKRQALRFDAALYALRLTFSQAVARAEARRAELEKSAPEFWRKLPAWVRGE